MRKSIYEHIAFGSSAVFANHLSGRASQAFEHPGPPYCDWIPWQPLPFLLLSSCQINEVNHSHVLCLSYSVELEYNEPVILK